MEEPHDYLRKVSKTVKDFENIQFNYQEDFFQLSYEIQIGKMDLDINSIRYMFANILNDMDYPRNLNYSGKFELIIVGEFQDHVRFVDEVAMSLSRFYLRTEILPVIRLIN